MRESTEEMTSKFPPKNWGSNVIPRDQWIDPNKTYQTRSGKEVIGLQIVMENSCGKEVTYPVKGSIAIKEKPLRLEYSTWSLDGRCDVVWGNNQELDLVEV